MVAQSLSVAAWLLYLCWVSPPVASNPIAAKNTQLAFCPPLPQPRKWGFATKLDPPPSQYGLKAILLAFGDQIYVCPAGNGATPAYRGTEMSTLYDIGRLLNVDRDLFNRLRKPAVFEENHDRFPMFGSVREASSNEMEFSQWVGSGDMLAPRFFFSGIVTKRVPGATPYDTSPAYDWMQIQDASSRLAYRVLTVGPDPDPSMNCAQEGQVFRKKYVAQYWFYSGLDELGFTEDNMPAKFCANPAWGLPEIGEQ